MKMWIYCSGCNIQRAEVCFYVTYNLIPHPGEESMLTKLSEFLWHHEWSVSHCERERGIRNINNGGENRAIIRSRLWIQKTSLNYFLQRAEAPELLHLSCYWCRVKKHTSASMVSWWPRKHQQSTWRWRQGSASRCAASCSSPATKAGSLQSKLQ